MSGHTSFVLDVAFSSDHSFLASSSSGTINLWSVFNNFTLMFQLSNGGNCYALVQLPNGQFAASSSNSNINIWDPSNNVASPIRTLIGHTNDVYSLALSPDASILASGAASPDNSVKLWMYASQTTPFKNLTGHTNRVKALCFVSNQILASGSFDLSIKIWNISSGKPKILFILFTKLIVCILMLCK